MAFWLDEAPETCGTNSCNRWVKLCINCCASAGFIFLTIAAIRAGALIFPGGNLSDIERLGYYDIIKKEYTFLESLGVGTLRFKNKITDWWIK